MSSAGYAVTGFVLWWGFTTGALSFPGGDTHIWDRVGDEIRSGISPYYLTDRPDLGIAFFYGPPWALAFAAVSWLPLVIVGAAITGLEVVSLRFVAGSWQRVGYCLWVPLIAFELPSGQFNLVIAATIAAAVRGEPRGAFVMAFQKLSPVLAIDPRQWRRIVPVAVVALAVTIPWLSLWTDWLRMLVTSAGMSFMPVIPIPYSARIVAAGLLLLLVRRPIARGLAAVIAIPAFHWISLLLFLALLPGPRAHPGANATSPA